MFSLRGLVLEQQHRKVSQIRLSPLIDPRSFALAVLLLLNLLVFSVNGSAVEDDGFPSTP